jgi:mono/diheme cytochrome c family protein
MKRMKKRLLYSITCLFDRPDDLAHAADVTSGKGYSKFDVHTPFPVHGMDRAMRIKHSGIGYFAFAFGAMGALTAVLFISWVTLSGYPLVIGGKPFWSWPAFVPIIFELTVLSTVVLSAVVLIAWYFKLPHIAHPLHDTPYMKSVSSDKFGISIQAADPMFNEAKVKALLKSLGGKKILSVYYSRAEAEEKNKLFEIKFFGIIIFTAVIVSAVTYFSLNRLLFMQPFNWMSEQPKLSAQEPYNFFSNGIGMRSPVEGTVARGFMPYSYKGKANDAAAYMVNPLPMTDSMLAEGRSEFLIFCSPCHGNFADGNSRLRGQFPNPPTLHTEKVRDWLDGRIFHIITEGQNAMPAYALQIGTEQRWAIINYIRALQRARDAKETDFK